MAAIAIRIGQGKTKANSREFPISVGAVTCNQCDTSYSLSADPSSADAGQGFAKYIEQVLESNHKRNEGHPDRIDSPDALPEVAIRVRTAARRPLPS